MDVSLIALNRPKRVSLGLFFSRPFFENSWTMLSTSSSPLRDSKLYLNKATTHLAWGRNTAIKQNQQLRQSINRLKQAQQQRHQ